jgi:Dihaem cytochrome c
VLLTLSCASGCNASLPEPESPAAQLYQKRCSVCHRLYAPNLLTSEMWQFMMGRMEMEMQRRSVLLPPPAERATILEYLQKHASNAAG